MRSVRKGLDTTYQTSSPESFRFPKWRRQKREDPDEVAIWRSVIDEFDFQICARRVVIFFFVDRPQIRQSYLHTSQLYDKQFYYLICDEVHTSFEYKNSHIV